MIMSLVCVSDYEKKAKNLLDKNTLGYYESGADEEYTLKLNELSFKSLRIRPRFLVDVSKVSSELALFGDTLKWPLGISPTAMQRLAHTDGEIGNARAAGKNGSVFILSTLSTTSIEELAQNAPNTIKWFQLYVHRDRELTENLVRRAEAAGFKAIVLTVDACVFGNRLADVRNKFQLPSHLSLANFTGDRALGVKSGKHDSGITEYVANQLDSSLTWKDLKWLVEFSKLPVLVKGILTREDALLAVEFGAAGIIVSNHGARQIDYTPSSIEALPEIVEAVGKKCPVMMDGGIRRGTDIFKALALGAKMVFMGRPALWGLAVNGEAGVENILQLLYKNFVLTMMLTGCSKLSNINRNMVVHESYYSKL